MRSFDVHTNGITVRVHEWSPADATASAARPLVFMHGWMDCGATFDLVAERLAAAGIHVLAPDARGFGESDRAPAGSYYHFPDYVADLAGLVEQLVPGGAPITLVGHSMGGSITTLYASARPARVARLVNVEGLGPPTHDFAEGAKRLSTWLDQLGDPRFTTSRPSSRADMLRRLCTGHPGVSPAVLETRLDQLITCADADVDACQWKADPRHRTTAPIPFIGDLYRAHATRIEVPVLFIAGGPAGYHPADEAERLTGFRDLRVATIPDAGHMVHWTHPAELAELLLPVARE